MRGFWARFCSRQDAQCNSWIISCTSLRLASLDPCRLLSKEQPREGCAPAGRLIVSLSMRGSELSRGPAVELPCPDVLALRSCAALLYTVMPCGGDSPAQQQGGSLVCSGKALLLRGLLAWWWETEQWSESTPLSLCPGTRFSFNMQALVSPAKCRLCPLECATSDLQQMSVSILAPGFRYSLLAHASAVFRTGDSSMQAYLWQEPVEPL